MFNFLKIFSSQSDILLKKLKPNLDKINKLEESFVKLSDEELKSKTDEFKKRIKFKEAAYKTELDELKKEFVEVSSPEEKEKVKEKIKAIKNDILEEVLPEAFAAVREASKRVIKMRHFDVQILGGMVLHLGKIAEMTTGEGKTLVATLPAYLNALSGEGVHVVTVNDYLAKRDRFWMGPVYESLGLSVGVIQHEMDDEERKLAYNSDITYGTNNEFGFDYLRDNMKFDKEDLVQRPFNFAIVDEVDSILIDEARTPLIISGPVEESINYYSEIKSVVENLYKKQEFFINSMMDKLEEAFKKDDNDAISKNLYIIHKGSPKNKRFIKFLSDEPKMKRSLEEVTLYYNRKDLASEKLSLEEELFYVFDERGHEATFTSKGQDEVSKYYHGQFDIGDIDEALALIKKDENLSLDEKLEKEQKLIDDFEKKNRRLDNLRQLLKAYVLFKKDVEYVVNNNKVIIVDEFTGRMMPGRRFSDGIHEALEAKESVTIEKESQTLATITFQNYFRMYEKLSGMTGTAMTEAQEFKKIYSLDSIAIPTNKPLKRSENHDLIFKTEGEKYNAVCREIVELYKVGRPVLVGTVTIEKSEKLSRLLRRYEVPHNVLNARYHEKEAEIISKAGQKFSVTISTNMAGRGTDIVLGEGVTELGGLHVIGTERHESRRIDNQLRGRAGRQGDPGSSRFFISLEDDLMRLFASDRIAKVMNFFQWEEGMPIEHNMLSRAIETAQKRVEEHNFSIRKHLIEYDNIMNVQRKEVYNYRRKVLFDIDIKSEIFNMAEEVILDEMDQCLKEDIHPKDWDTKVFITWARNKLMLDISDIDFENLRRVQIEDEILERLKHLYEDKENFINSERMRMIEKYIMLQTIDTWWKRHLRNMDELREWIGFRAYGQVDPLIEYKREAYSMFSEMENSVKEETIEKLFKVQIVKEEERRPVFNINAQKLIHAEAAAIKDLPKTQAQNALQNGEDLVEEKAEPFKREFPKVGRNDPCPCGSGKKYKKCCGINQ